MNFIFNVFFLFALVNAVTLSDLFEEEWKAYKTFFHKHYDEENEQHYKQNFITNMIHINAHNKLYEMGKVTYKMGINQFTDLSNKEFNKYIHPSMKSIRTQSSIKTNLHDLPSQIDWRDEGAVTPVSDQGQFSECGFGVIGSLEGQYFLNTSQLVQLSEQFVYRCANSSLNCFVEEIFEFLENTGICSANDYDENMDCDEIPILFKISDYEEIEQGNEIALQTAVANIGPIQVAIDATYLLMYVSGIFYSNECSSTELNHEALVVGYGTEDDVDYWIVKNSWGTGWGEDGYIRMARNQDNNCGIASYAHYPIL